MRLGLLRIDVARVAQDRFLLGVTGYIIGLTIAMRWAVPWIGTEVMARLAFDLTPYYPLMMSHFLVQLAPLVGGILGTFLLLEARETGFMRALLVTPVPLSAYLTALCGVLALLSVVLTVLEGLIIGIGIPSSLGLLACGVAGAPAAVVMALVLGGLASTKTEAFAYMKIWGVLPLLPTASYFLPEPWQWLAAIYPPYWASKAFWIAEAGGWWLPWVLGGVVLSAIQVWFAARYFTGAAHRC